MEVLAQVLPILIYLLLIILVVIGIVLGIKLIITIDKVNVLVDDVNKKVERVTPIFNAVGFVSDKMSNVFTTVASAAENVVNRFINKNNEEEDENE